MHNIELVEYEPYYLAYDELAESDALRIYSQFKDKLTIEWPSPVTQRKWKLTSQGWVGYIPIAADRGISIQPKVPLINLFRMLEYAYDLGSFQILDGNFDSKSINDIYERLAIILSNRLLDRARIGLYKTYKENHECLSYIRGRIDMTSFSRSAVRSSAPCFFEDHTYDIEENQIIAWTLHTILRSGICTDRGIPILRKAERVLWNSISLQQYYASDCVGRTYNRLNQDYETLHKLCRFFLDNTGPTQDLGDRSMIPFLVNMAYLFELFVARWLAKNLDSRYMLKSQETFAIGEEGTPKLQMDLILYDRSSQRPLCVLDTKYKAQPTVSTQDYSQVVAYADKLHCDVAFLVYPIHLDIPLDHKPGNVHVKTVIFDLGTNLEEAGKAFLQKVYESF